MRIKHQTSIWGAVFLAALWLLGAISTADASKGMTIEQAYPGLASGILKTARLETLEKGVVLKTDDLQIDESFLGELLKEIDQDLRPQYEKNLFFVMEQQAIEKVLLHEARKSGAKADGPAREIIVAFLGEKVAGTTVSDEETMSFYEVNKAELGGVSFEQVKEGINQYLLERKRQEAIFSYVETLGEQLNIRLDAKWVEKQNALARDNPVDKARFSGKPTLVEFGATGCAPCDMMQPILETLKKKFNARINIVFVHVGEDQILGVRYGINSIPVQVFFDRDGKEFFRHVGFFPQEEIEKQLAAMGVS
jgi:thiol-disulfide isomerase/thioredoxin